MAQAPGAATAGMRAWWFVAVLSAAAILSIIDRGILNLVVDPVRGDLALTDTQIGLLQGLAFGLFYATAGVALGVAVDRHSRRGLIIAGITIWSLATLASGFARSFGELFVARLLVGFGEAALAPAAISIIADLFPAERRGRPMGIYMAGQAIANGLAIFLTGRVVATAADGGFDGVPLVEGLAPWRIAFVLFGVAGLVLVLALCTCREPARQGAPAPTSLRGQAGAAAQEFRRRWRFFLPLYLGFAVTFTAAYGAAAWSPTLLKRVHGLAPAELGATLGPLTMAFAVAGPLLGGWLLDRLVRRGGSRAIVGLLAYAPLGAIPAGCAVLARDPLLATVLVASSSAVFAFVGLCVLTTLQAQLVPQMRGIGVALTGLLNTLIGAITGPLLIAVVTDRVFADPQRVGDSIAVVVVPALLVAAVLFAGAARALRVSATGAPAAT